jgi:hypothetical protein
MCSPVTGKGESHQGDEKSLGHYKKKKITQLHDKKDNSNSYFVTLFYMYTNIQPLPS